jgi:hypothetical protein
MGLRVTAAEVKAALRRRHPGEPNGAMVGQWTCIEEWANIDLVALNAWAKADVIGYEVKVSRSDYRAELLKPHKRAHAVAMCTEFYFAVPHGLLTAEELAFEEPEWEPEDWERMRCPGMPTFGPPDEFELRRATRAQRDLLDVPHRYGGQCRGRGRRNGRERGPFTVRLPVPYARIDTSTHTNPGWAWYGVEEAERAVRCPTCAGKGYVDRSRVEAESPTLWVPRDVGLIEITARGCRVTRKSPRRPDAPGLIPVNSGSTPKAGRQAVAQLVRWTSNRPDPRHARLRAETT